jgi:hypothetical protein
MNLNKQTQTRLHHSALGQAFARTHCLSHQAIINLDIGSGSHMRIWGRDFAARRHSTYIL